MKEALSNVLQAEGLSTSRDSYFMHGDQCMSISTATQGCIILERDVLLEPGIIR